MMARAAPSWQLLLADLSLILFIATAAALAHSEEAAAEQTATGFAADGTAVAMLRGQGGPGDEALLAQWLRQYQADPREQLTLTIYYAPDAFDALQERVAGLHGIASEAGQTPRIVLEQASRPAWQASFAFDQPPSDIQTGPPAEMARNLQP